MRQLFALLFTFITFFSFAQPIEIPNDDTMNPYVYTGFTLSYSEEHEQAEWVAYELTREEALGEIGRTDNFRQDPNVATGTASLSDYRGSGYDRGHLAPAGDMAWSQQSMVDSFYFSNMSPQDPSFNRAGWRMLEALVREWAIEYGTIYVVTGPVLTDGPYETIGNNEVAIPRYYFKAILFIGDYNRAIGFLMPNRRITSELQDYAVSIDFLEAILELDLFYKIDDNIEEEIESSVNFHRW